MQSSNSPIQTRKAKRNLPRTSQHTRETPTCERWNPATASSMRPHFAPPHPTKPNPLRPRKQQAEQHPPPPTEFSRPIPIPDGDRVSNQNQAPARATKLIQPGGTRRNRSCARQRGSRTCRNYEWGKLISKGIARLPRRRRRRRRRCRVTRGAGVGQEGDGSVSVVQNGRRREILNLVWVIIISVL
jgi:hypothetical protein